MELYTLNDVLLVSHAHDDAPGVIWALDPGCDFEALGHGLVGASEGVVARDGDVLGDIGIETLSVVDER